MNLGEPLLGPVATAWLPTSTSRHYPRQQLVVVGIYP